MKKTKSAFMIVLAVLAVINTFLFAVPASAAFQEKESNNTFTTADSMASGQSVTGKLADKYDKDYYSFNVKYNGFLTIDFVHNYADSYANWNIELYYSEEAGRYTGINASNGFVVIRPKDDERYCILASGVKSGDTVYVKIESDGLSVPQVDYTLEFNLEKSESFEKERNESFDTATPLKTNSKIKGNYCTRSDSDYYSFIPGQRGTYEFVFTHDYDALEFKWNVDVYKYENYGYVKQSTSLKRSIWSTDAERISVFKFDAEAGERYYINVFKDYGYGGNKPVPVLIYGLECVMTGSGATEIPTPYSNGVGMTRQSDEEETYIMLMDSDYSDAPAVFNDFPSTTTPAAAHNSTKPATTVKTNNQINLSYDKPDAKKPLQKDDLYIGGQEEAPTYEYEEFEGGAIHSDEENGGNSDYRPSPVMKIIFVFAATVIAAVVLTLVVTLCFNKKARCR